MSYLRLAAAPAVLLLATAQAGHAVTWTALANFPLYNITGQPPTALIDVSGTYGNMGSYAGWQAVPYPQIRQPWTGYFLYRPGDAMPFIPSSIERLGGLGDFFSSTQSKAYASYFASAVAGGNGPIGTKPFAFSFEVFFASGSPSQGYTWGTDNLYDSNQNLIANGVTLGVVGYTAPGGAFNGQYTLFLNPQGGASLTSVPFPASGTTLSGWWQINGSVGSRNAQGTATVEMWAQQFNTSTGAYDTTRVADTLGTASWPSQTIASQTVRLSYSNSSPAVSSTYIARNLRINTPNP